MPSRKKSNLFVGTLLVCGDSLLIYAGLVLAFWLRFKLPHKFDIPPVPEYLKAYVVVTIVMLFVYRSLGLYNRHWSLISSSEVFRIIKATAGGIVVMMVPAFMYKNLFEYSTGVAVVAVFTVSALIIIFRKLFGRFEVWFFRKMGLNKRLMIIGTGDRARHLIENVRGAPQLCYDIVGAVAEDGESANEVAGVPILACISNADQVLLKGRADEAILTLPKLDHEIKEKLILQCERELIDFRMIPDVYEVLTSRVEVVNIDGVPLLGLKGIPLDSAANRFIKRCLDTVVSATGLIVVSPVLAGCALFIKLGSKGPVFFKQKRCGENSKTFTLYKLRTMMAEAEENSGPVMTAQNDPRVTRIGNFLRKFDLDELPQLINVIKGDMSLVGPRPERPFFIEQLKGDIHRYMSRHMVKAGMTGWAQVHGLRQNTSFEERVKYDLFYLENWSIWFDIKILAMTLFKKTHPPAG